MELSFIVLLGLSVSLVMDVVSSQEPVYFKKGSSIKMDPNISDPIKSIEWRFGSDIVAEYVKDTVALTYYDPFKGRAVLDTTTGILTINNMDSSLAVKEYSLEANSLILGKKFKATELPELPKPAVWIRPLACSKADSSCTRVCDLSKGSGTDTGTKYGPVTYSWKEDSGEWKDGGQSMVFFKNETSGVAKFFCRAKSPVSLQESDAKDNPLHEPPAPPTPIIIGVLAAVAALAGAGFGVYKTGTHEKLLGMCRSSDGAAGADPATPKENGSGNPGTNDEKEGLAEEKVEDHPC